MSRLHTGAALAVLILLAAGSLEGDKFLEKADEKFEQSATRAQEAYAKSMGDAYQTRLKTYRTILAAATKAGDFDRATALKERIEELEAAEQEIGQLAPGKKKARTAPKGAVKFGGHQYLLIKDAATWHVAKSRCEEMGGHLACIETPQEEQFVRELCGKESVWFGATDEEQESKWKWINGAPVEIQIRIDGMYDHWLALYDQTWHDGGAGARYAFVCEWE
jgi:hypothetical protein